MVSYLTQRTSKEQHGAQPVTTTQGETLGHNVGATRGPVGAGAHVHNKPIPSGDTGRGQGRTGRATLQQFPHIPFLTLSQRAYDGRDTARRFRRGDLTQTDQLPRSLGAGLSTPQPLLNLCGGSKNP